MVSTLYPRQKQIVDFLSNFIKENGTAPTLTDIKNHLHVKTLSTVHEHLAKLEAKGIISRVKEDSGIYFSLNIPEINPGILLSIPLVGVIAAGKPILAIENICEFIQFPKNMINGDTDNIFALRVKGDSMIDEHIKTGDIVLIRKCDSPNIGDMVVALVNNDEATLKRYFIDKKNHNIILRPSNEEYKDIIVKKAKIQGVVVGLIRKY